MVKSHAVIKTSRKAIPQLRIRKGNNSADTLANIGSASIALPELCYKAHLLSIHVVVALQVMLLACYTRRQTKRQELALDTIIERQLEGEVPLGVELAAPVALPENRTVIHTHRENNVYPSSSFS